MVFLEELGATGNKVRYRSLRYPCNGLWIICVLLTDYGLYYVWVTRGLDYLWITPVLMEYLSLPGASSRLLKSVSVDAAVLVPNDFGNHTPVCPCCMIYLHAFTCALQAFQQLLLEHIAIMSYINRSTTVETDIHLYLPQKHVHGLPCKFS